MMKFLSFWLALFCLIGSSSATQSGWKNLDLLFVVDGKLPISDNSWQHGKDFVKAIVRNTSAAVNTGSTLVGLLQFNFYANMRIRMRADLSQRLLRRIDQVASQYAYFVRLGKALRKAELVMDHHRLRNAPKLVIILIHSRSLDQFHSRLTSMRKQGIKTVLIDVGEMYISTKVGEFASHYIPVKSYSKLMSRLPQVTNIVQQHSDLDECKANQHNCNVHATCANRQNGFECKCMKGWYGNGTKCWSYYGETDSLIDDRSDARPVFQAKPPTLPLTSWKLENDLDIIFAIGTSRSLGAQGFRRIKELILKVVRKMESQSTEHKVQIGVATFYYITRLKVPLKSWKIDQLQRSMARLRYRPGTLLAGMALNKVKRMLNEQGRKTSKKVTVMFMSGPLFHAQRKIQQNKEDSKVIVVNVGPRGQRLPFGMSQQDRNMIFMDDSSSVDATAEKLASEAAFHDVLM